MSGAMFWRDNIDPSAEPFKVLIKKGEFIDEERHGRLVPYKIYYPAAHNLKKIPIVLWSHGFGGNQDGASFLSRFLAANGFILVHMTHIGTDSRLWEGKPGHPWDILRKTVIKRQTTISRFEDVPLTLDRLHNWAKQHPEAGAYMDFDNIGMSGHSFGALTTQVMAGMLFPGEDHKSKSFKEPRFKAGILYSPVPVDHLGPDDAGGAEASAEVYAGIDIPLMHMTGTEDSSPISGISYDHRFAVYEGSTKADKYLLVKEGGDHMVYNGTRGKLGENPLRERHEDIIKITALAFWEAYLKGNEAAKEWLAGAGAQAYIDGYGELRVKV